MAAEAAAAASCTLIPGAAVPSGRAAASGATVQRCLAAHCMPERMLPLLKQAYVTHHYVPDICIDQLLCTWCLPHVSIAPVANFDACNLFHILQTFV
jgi:hypothetical protein